MSQIITRTPAALAAELEANGPGACLTRRAWHVLAVLMRAAPGSADVDVDISHQDIALRAAYRSTKSVQRALAELVGAGLIDHHPGDRIGHGTTEVRISRVRVWLEAVETLLDDGRELVRLTRERAWSITQARMRVLLDARSRRRRTRASVDNLAGLLDVALDPQTRRSPVVDRLSTSPPGLGPVPGGGGAPDPYVPEICPHDWQIAKCPRCKP